MTSLAAPPAPIAVANPACLAGTEIVMVAAPPAGVINYWQGTSSTSSSQANDASSPYFVTETGTYYVKAFDTASSCWSEPVGLPVTIHTYIPPAPIADPNVFAFCTSDDPMTVNVDAPNVSGTVTFTLNENGSLSAMLKVEPNESEKEITLSKTEDNSSENKFDAVMLFPERE